MLVANRSLSRSPSAAQYRSFVCAEYAGGKGVYESYRGSNGDGQWFDNELVDDGAGEL